MSGSCSDTLISIQNMYLRSTKRFRTVQRHNDRCHTRWRKPPLISWRVFAESHALVLWPVVLSWLNQEQDNKGLMTLEKKTKRQLRQSKTWQTPYPWMDFHRHFLLSGFWYSLRSLYCIYQLGNCCQFREVYHDAVINCKVPLCFLRAVISCTFLSRVWGGVSVRSSEPMDGKNWHFWFYWWLVVKKHHIVKIWQTQEPSVSATECQQKGYSW